jgi:hypothetical protein
MRILFAAATLLLALSASAAPYEACFIENSKGVTDPQRIQEIKNICREKETPQKCRKFLPHNQPAGQSEVENGLAEEALKSCISSCANAGFVSRHFGNECSTD